MQCTKPQFPETVRTFAEQIRARDWNAVISPACFTERGLEGLQQMIEAHGREAMDLAVRDFLARSKSDRVIRRGHVRSWHFFGPYIVKQKEREGVSCAE